MVSLLADKFSQLEGRVVSTSEVFSKISERLVPFQMIKDIFTDMSTEGGIFYNMQEIQSETLKGKISNLTDAYQLMFASMGDSDLMNGALKGTVDLLMNIAKNWQDVAASILPVVAAIGVYKTAMIVTDGINKAQISYYSISQGLVNAKIASIEREIAVETAKNGIQNAGLMYAKANAAADALSVFMSGKKTQLVHSEVAALTIKNLVLKAGNDAQKLSILQDQISAVLQAHGIEATLASAAAQKIYTASVETSSTATKGFFATMMATNPVGWVMALVSAFILLGSTVYYFISKANELDKELNKISAAGALDEEKMVSKFVALAKTATSTSKTFAEQEEALKKLKNIYGEMLPTYALTREYLLKMNGDYTSLTDSIHGYIEAKTKEKEIEAVRTNYEDNINPVYSDIIDGLKKAGVSAGDAKRAMAEFQKQVEAGNTAGLSMDENFNKLKEIIFDINGQKITNEIVGFFDPRYTSENLARINTLLRQQKETLKEIADESSKSPMWGKLTKGDDALKKSIEASLKTMKQGVMEVKGIATPFDESLYQFNERKAKKEQDMLIDHIEKLTNKSYETLRKGIANNTLNFPDLGAAKYMMNLFGQIDKLDTSPVQNKIHEIITKMSALQGVSSSQYGTMEFQKGSDQSEYFENLQKSYKSIKEKIEETKRATKDWTTDIQVASGVTESGFRPITKGELLNGYKSVENGVKKTNAGLVDQLELIKMIGAAFGIELEKQKKQRQVKDPNIQLLEDEMKAVEQAKKKYEELQKAGYSSADSLAVVKRLYSSQLSGKFGLQLAFDSDGLIKQYNKYIDGLSKMKGTKKAQFEAELKINDVQVDDVVKSLKAKLKEIENEFNTDKKRIDLFKNIFDVTSDFNLAGRIAASFEGNGTTDIAKAMQKALKSSFETAKININDFIDSKGNVDFVQAGNTINELLKVKGQEDNIALQSAKKQLEISKDFKEKEIVELLKGLQDFSSYEERKTAISRKAIEERYKISIDPDLNKADKEKLTNSSLKKEQESIGKINVEQFKDSPMWAETFSNMDKVSKNSLQLLKSRLKELIELEQSNAEPTQLKELMKSLEEVEKRTGELDFGKLFKTMFEHVDLTPLKEKVDETAAEVKRLEKIREDAVKREGIAKSNTKTILDGVGGDTTNEYYIQAKKAEENATDRVTEATKNLTEAQKKSTAAENAYTTASDKKKKAMLGAADTIKETIGQLSAIKSAVSDSADAFYQMADAMGIAIDPTTKEIIDDVVKSLGAVIAVLTAIVSLLVAIAILEAIVGSTFVIIAAAVAAVIAAFKIFKSLSLKHINDEIKAQQMLVKMLEEQYQDLERAMQSALGVDWLKDYNAELINLAATQQSLQKQVELEKSKGKDADQAKIDELNKSIKENAITQEGMAKKLQQFVSGTDLSSAAKDFATAWIDAYKSFGNTTDAMKSKFKDMLKNMVVNTILAKAMEVALKPVFDLMEQAAKPTSDGNAAFTPAELKKIVDQSTKSMTDIDATNNALMEGLKAAGIDIRDSSSNLSGVSKGISGITEDTALLLGGYLDSIRYRLFAYLDLMSATKSFDIAGSMATLMIAQNTQIGHLEGIKSNTLRSAIAAENLSKKIDSVIAVSNTGTGYAIKANV